MQYRRTFVPGGTYFFTVVAARRRRLFDNEDTIQLVRQAFHHVNTNRPFTVNAMVILPNHLHCIWTLPSSDDDYPTRWRLIKTWVTKHYPSRRHHDTNSSKQRELTLWQARYWEHLIRNGEDYRQHVEYIHYNPVKYGQVRHPWDWPHSSFRQYVREGLYPREWGATEPTLNAEIGHE